MKRYGDGRRGFPSAVLLLLGLAPLSAAAQASAPQPAVAAPAAFGVEGRTPLMVLHGVGAQIYACVAGADGKTAWTFREPVATLVDGGKTVGRHYLGPTWALADGTTITGKSTASAPGAAPEDVPLLKLEVTRRPGAGPLAAATLVLRLNTRGGALQGECDHAGDLRAEPYSADYVFLR